MRAAVLNDIEKIEYREDYPKPTLGPDDVLVKVHYCGVCGSDISNFKYKMYQVPLIMGHELSGEVVELGGNIPDFKIGDMVVGINVDLKIGGPMDQLGIFKDGGYAEYVKVPKKYLFSTPAAISHQDAIFIETYANGFRGIKKSRIEKGEKIMVIGVGAIGLTLLDALIKEMAPEYIIAVELNEYLRGKAKEIGADDAFPPSRVKINKFIKARGRPSYIFDCAGAEASLKTAMDHIKKGGTIVLEGILRKRIDFPIMEMNSKEICLQGVMGKDRDDIQASINYFKEGKFDPSKFPTKIIQLKDTQKEIENFITLKNREFVKMIIEI